MLKDAANGGDPNTACNKHRSSSDVFMQRKGSSGSGHRELRAKSSSLQSGFKGCLTHAHRDHNWLFVSGRACERKRMGVVGVASDARVPTDKIGMLPGSEFEIDTICVEPKGHRLSGDSLP